MSHALRFATSAFVARCSYAPSTRAILSESILAVMVRQRTRIEVLERANKELEAREAKRKSRARVVIWFVVVILAIVAAFLFAEYVWPINTTTGT